MTTTHHPHHDHHHHHHSSDPLDWLREAVPGEPGEDYPIYYQVPQTSFSCEGRVSGYYADPKTRCQAFRVCNNEGKGFSRELSFLCPNGTIFDQEHFTCSWWNLVDCNVAESFYELNDKIGVVPSDSSNRNPSTTSSPARPRPPTPPTATTNVNIPQPPRPQTPFTQPPRPPTPARSQTPFTQPPSSSAASSPSNTLQTLSSSSDPSSPSNILHPAFSSSDNFQPATSTSRSHNLQTSRPSCCHLPPSAP
ncbi:uncharacterized protein LOC143041318 [Oratosquilla oratoria]|uniref:uncharacterized protein LOC143041318 n=1 Tax=Oratosquilla oratoria TaxID=337810 RepID=UPI003F75F5BA